MQHNIPQSQGLYDSRFEHDACGVGLLVNINGVKSHQLVEKGLQVLEHMVHVERRVPTPRRATVPVSWYRFPTNSSCCRA